MTRGQAKKVIAKYSKITDLTAGQQILLDTAQQKMSTPIISRKCIVKAIIVLIIAGIAVIASIGVKAYYTELYSRNPNYNPFFDGQLVHTTNNN